MLSWIFAVLGLFLRRENSIVSATHLPSQLAKKAYLLVVPVCVAHGLIL